jgi:hypothetical protein
VPDSVTRAAQLLEKTCAASAVVRSFARLPVARVDAGFLNDEEATV